MPHDHVPLNFEAHFILRQPDMGMEAFQKQKSVAVHTSTGMPVPPWPCQPGPRPKPSGNGRYERWCSVV